MKKLNNRFIFIFNRTIIKSLQSNSIPLHSPIIGHILKFGKGSLQLQLIDPFENWSKSNFFLSSQSRAPNFKSFLHNSTRSESQMSSDCSHIFKIRSCYLIQLTDCCHSSRACERSVERARSERAKYSRSAEQVFIQRLERSLCLAPVPLRYRSHHEPRACTNPP